MAGAEHATDTMKAAVVHRKGGPTALTWEDVPRPRPRPGEALVRVEAAGVNFADIDRRSGDRYPVPTPLPYVLGNEFAGVVEELGDGVAGPPPGTRVFGLVDPVASGCYAQYVAVPAATVVPLPDGLDPADATALLVQGLTAYLALRDGLGVRAGESVLVLAAAGGVGSMAVQLAKILGAGFVAGAAGSEEKRRLVRELGADAAIDYTRPGWAKEALAATGGRGFDTALISAGDDTLSEALGALAPLGRARLLGAPAGQALAVDFFAELAAGRLAGNQSLGFFGLSAYQAMGALSALFEGLAALIGLTTEGRLRPVARHRLPLSRAAEAHALLEGRRSTGKVVLLPWDSG